MSKAEREMVRRHVDALIVEAHAAGVPEDVLGRLLLEATLAIWQRSRSCDDIADELQFTAENLDPDTDYAFMRP